MFKNRYYLIAFLILVLDHVTKWAVRVKLDRDLPVTLIPGYLRLSYWENSGVAFGLFDSVVSVWKPYVLAAMAVVAVTVVVIYSLHLPPERRLLHVALAVLTGGILGNFVDRLLRGYVVDFIDFHIHDIFTWPTFNVADSAITIGIALLLIDTVLNPAVEKAAEPPPIHSPE
ncbi:MAG: signal peptidase II [Acidobacteriota bacterium]|jgi:signal peptidase II|nr:signal peptidase II [Acidobacteriota bacterium]